MNYSYKLLNRHNFPIKTMNYVCIYFNIIDWFKKFVNIFVIKSRISKYILTK